MTSNGVRVTARELTWMGMLVTLIGVGVWMGTGLTNLRRDVQALRSDICQYAVPAQARPFAASCHDQPTGLQAQALPLPTPPLIHESNQ